MKLKNYYTLLNILPSASTDEIKKAYRKLAKVWHPDKNKSNQAGNMFQRIHEAYQTLIDPVKRQVYNFKHGQTFEQPAPQKTSNDSCDTDFCPDSILRKNCERMTRKTSKKSTQAHEQWLKNNFWANWAKKMENATNFNNRPNYAV